MHLSLWLLVLPCLAFLGHSREVKALRPHNKDPIIHTDSREVMRLCSVFLLVSAAPALPSATDVWKQELCRSGNAKAPQYSASATSGVWPQTGRAARTEAIWGMRCSSAHVVPKYTHIRHSSFTSPYVSPFNEHKHWLQWLVLKFLAWHATELQLSILSH